MNRICLYLGLLLTLTACQAVGPASSNRMLRPGDTIAGMKLATGAMDAPPLWAFCSPTRQEGNVITCECELPVLPSLAIGNLPFPVNAVADDIEWSALRWALSIDDRPLDLEAFGTYRYVMPVTLKKPSLPPEAVKDFTAWDIVLTNLSPGEHTLYGTAQTETASTLWVIRLTIREDR